MSMRKGFGQWRQRGRWALGVWLLACLAPARARAGSPADAELSGTAAPGAPLRAHDAASPVEKLSRPWNMGVTEQQQEVARQHLKEGNALLKNSQFKQAAEKYHQGLAVWNHPGLHFNLALALINLDDQPVELYEQLKMAVQYGKEPLGDEKFERAQDSLKLVKKQIAEVDVRCTVQGVVVALDGKELFRVGDAPGQWRGFLIPGQHTVTAAKPGFATTERSRVLLPGQPETFDLKVYTADELIGYRRRWPLWRPVSVTALGAAMLITGGVLTLETRSRFNAYDDYSTSKCASGGCTDDPELARLRSEGKRFQNVSAFFYAFGGVSLAAGVVLLLFDRAVPYQVNPDIDRVERKDLALRRAPILTPWLVSRSGGLLGTWSF
jgi:hypothetical protein